LTVLIADFAGFEATSIVQLLQQNLQQAKVAGPHSIAMSAVVSKLRGMPILSAVAVLR